MCEKETFVIARQPDFAVDGCLLITCISVQVRVHVCVTQPLLKPIFLLSSPSFAFPAVPDPSAACQLCTSAHHVRAIIYSLNTPKYLPLNTSGNLLPVPPGKDWWDVAKMEYLVISVSICLAFHGSSPGARGGLLCSESDVETGLLQTLQRTDYCSVSVLFKSEPCQITTYVLALLGRCASCFGQDWFALVSWVLCCCRPCLLIVPSTLPSSNQSHMQNVMQCIFKMM